MHCSDICRVRSPLPYAGLFHASVSCGHHRPGSSMTSSGPHGDRHLGRARHGCARDASAVFVSPLGLGSWPGSPTAPGSPFLLLKAPLARSGQPACRADGAPHPHTAGGRTESQAETRRAVGMRFRSGSGIPGPAPSRSQAPNHSLTRLS